MTLRSRTRKLGCFLPGMRSSNKADSHRALMDEDDDDDDINDNTEQLHQHHKSYNLAPQMDLPAEELEPMPAATPPSSPKSNQHLQLVAVSTSQTEATTPTAQPGLMTASSDSSSTNTWHDLAQVPLSEFELDYSSISDRSSITGTGSYHSLPATRLKRRNYPRPASQPSTALTAMSAPSSPYRSVSGTSSLTSSHWTKTPTSQYQYPSSTPVSPTWSVNSSPAAFFPSGSASVPTTPSRRSGKPLTTPLPRRSPSLSRSSSASSLLMPTLALPAPTPMCEQVQTTLHLLRSIKNQIRALKRNEAKLSSQFHVQRRERAQMVHEITRLEARRLRVEAMFVRPLPLVVLLPVDPSRSSSPKSKYPYLNQSQQDEYDLCLVSEGNDAWNTLQPLIRIQLVPPGNQAGALSSRMGAVLLHFGPTRSQPMAAAISFVRHANLMTGSPTSIAHLDLQPLTQQYDPVFWERVSSGQVMEADANQLDDASCQYLFDALTEHQHLWRNQVTQVVDKKTRRIQWILQQEADTLYYDAIPAAASTSSAIVSCSESSSDSVGEATSPSST